MVKVTLNSYFRLLYGLQTLWLRFTSLLKVPVLTSFPVLHIAISDRVSENVTFLSSNRKCDELAIQNLGTRLQAIGKIGKWKPQGGDNLGLLEKNRKTHVARVE